MDNNILGIIVSFAFIFLIIGIATIVQKFVGKDSELPRKLVHILLGIGSLLLLSMINSGPYY